MAYRVQHPGRAYQTADGRKPVFVTKDHSVDGNEAQETHSLDITRSRSRLRHRRQSRQQGLRSSVRGPGPGDKHRRGLLPGRAPSRFPHQGLSPPGYSGFPPLPPGVFGGNQACVEVLAARSERAGHWRSQPRPGDCQSSCKSTRFNPAKPGLIQARMIPCMQHTTRYAHQTSPRPGCLSSSSGGGPAGASGWSPGLASPRRRGRAP